MWWGSPGGGASRARAGGAGAGGTRTRRQEMLWLQHLRKRAVRWGSPSGGAWGATPGGTYESTPAGSAVGRRGSSGGGQQQQQRPPETLSPQQLCERAVWWGCPGGGGFRGTRTRGVEATSLGVCDSASTGAESEEALLSFTLDSGTSYCFFRDCTTVTPLTVPVPITLADPSGGPVIARGSTVLPCPAAPSGSLSGLHLPSFAKNLVATTVLQDQWVTVTQPGGELVAICTDSRTGEHLATFTRGLGLTLLWHHHLGHPSLPRLRGMHSRLLVSGRPRSLPPLPRSLAPPCLPCVEGRQRAAPHSSFPPTTAPLHTLHMDVGLVVLPSVVLCLQSPVGPVTVQTVRFTFFSSHVLHLLLSSHSLEESLTVFHDPLSDYLRASRLVVSRVFLALVTHPTAPLSSVSALVTTVAGFASSHRFDYAAHLVLEDRQFELAEEAEMASYRSTGAYVNAVPPPGANVVSGMWLYKVKRLPGAPPVFKARYVVRGFSQRERVDFF
ncbi:unnamed protein product [Closterium sp. NIES-53]